MFYKAPFNVFPELRQINLTGGEPVEVLPGIGITSHHLGKQLTCDFHMMYVVSIHSAGYTMHPLAKNNHRGGTLSVIQHGRDVAAVMHCLLHSPAYRKSTEILAGRSLTPTDMLRLAVLAALHDTGKLTPGFQRRIRSTTVIDGPHVSQILWFLAPAGVTSRWRESPALRSILPWFSSETSFANAILGLATHHGSRKSWRKLESDANLPQTPLAGYDAERSAAEFWSALQRDMGNAFAGAEPLPSSARFWHHFAGLVALADQIGSNEALFPLNRDEPFEAGLARAKLALDRIGIGTRPLRESVEELTPGELFDWPSGARLRPMQMAIDTVPLDVLACILESETGSGKTEAAILHFVRLLKAGLVEGIYFAVPTRSAAVQLHRRVNAAVKRLLGMEALLAVPGYMRMGGAEGAALPGYKVSWDDDPETRRLDRWSAETGRRFLAAPIAVGTVDQAMLSALDTRWSHMRGATLSRSLLVIDEVHASDAYMTSVIERLLRDHTAAGGRALLMSATLGGAARARWLGRDGGQNDESAPYPLISHSRGVIPCASDAPVKHVRMTPVREMEHAERVARRAIAAARAGARVLVIRNSVRAATDVLDAIERIDSDAPLLSVNGSRTLHTGRFAPEDRRLLDAAVEDALGKHGPAAPVIVIGTQTLEQSLDIDADLLITDLCPVDVLLQRLGRLFRHERLNRPDGFRTPQCALLVPDRLHPEARLGAYGLGRNRAYENLTGLKACLEQITLRETWTIPEENRALVEAGTDPLRLDELADELGPEWSQDLARCRGGATGMTMQAQINALDRSTAFHALTQEPPARAPTRCGDPSEMIAVPEGTTGPFGTAISGIVVPVWMADPVGNEVTIDPGETIRITIGNEDLVYDRKGLRKMS